jgi:hypothetical protein
VERIGMLLQAQPDGSISRVVVSGRVLLNETVREALWRHLSKDLGPDAAPRLPTDAAPFTVVEYFPDPSRSGYHDARQHAVALGFVVPCDGECVPPPSALDLTWMTPEEALSDGVIDEMTDGHARLVRLALSHCVITASPAPRPPGSGRPAVERPTEAGSSLSKALPSTLRTSTNHPRP